jgi:anaerobic magnesium-protoporphyrin IX monomethyl ester cyclase
MPYPGTDLYRMGLASGILPCDYWRKFARHPTPDFVPMVWEEVLRKGELLAELSRAYRRYYGRPAYLLRRVMEVRSWEELRSKVWLAGKIFFGRAS